MAAAGPPHPFLKGGWEACPLSIVRSSLSVPDKIFTDFLSLLGIKVLHVGLWTMDKNRSIRRLSIDRLSIESLSLASPHRRSASRRNMDVIRPTCRAPAGGRRWM